jgi:hypothetical protein
VLHDLDTNVLIEVISLEGIKGLGCIEEGCSTTGNNTFITGSSGGAECVLDSVFELLDLNFGGSSDLDDSNTSGKSSKSFLEFFFIVF